MQRRRIPLVPLAVALAASAAGVVVAQIDGGNRGVAPVDSSGAYEVDGVAVDVSAPTPTPRAMPAGGSRSARHGGSLHND